MVNDMKWRFSNNKLNKAQVAQRERSKTVMQNMLTSGNFGKFSFWWHLRALADEGIISLKWITITVSATEAISILSDEFTKFQVNSDLHVGQTPESWKWFIRSTINGDTDIACLYGDKEMTVSVAVWSNLGFQPEIPLVLSKLNPKGKAVEPKN